jgi:hypothetical protein
MAAIIHVDPRVCDRRLRQYFNSTREQWIEVVKAAVAARARCTDDNARAAPGFYAWDAATTRARQIFRREGWDKGDHNGIEIIIHHEMKKMIAMMNTDAGTSDVRPSEVGPHSERPYQLWYLCIHDDGGHVRAELSRPSEFYSGYVVDFSERIFIVGDGDWEKIAIAPVPDAPEDFAVEVRRK